MVSGPEINIKADLKNYNINNEPLLLVIRE
jgi:hypothetical protein